jgi:hypothetical protein
LGKRAAIVFALLLTLVISTLAQVPKAKTDWDQWSFLLGTWDAVGEGFPPHPNANVDTFTFSLDREANQMVWNRHRMYFIFDGPQFVTDERTLIKPDGSGGFEAETAGRKGSGDFYGVDGKRKKGGYTEYSTHWAVRFSTTGDSLIFLSVPIEKGGQDRWILAKAGADTMRVAYDRISTPPGYQTGPSSLECVVRRAASRP